MFTYFKHDTKYLYHYTTAKIAYDYILNDRQLKISQYTKTNDPKETKNWHFHVGTNKEDGIKNLSHKEMDKLSEKLGYRLKSAANVLCFSKDRKLTGEHLRDIYNRGYCKPRMWAHYGDNHKGVCLIFGKEDSTKRIKLAFFPKRMIVQGHVHYVNRSVVGNIFTSPYGIFYDRLEEVGFEQYIVDHLYTHHKRLFFEKAEDWSSEDEYRWVLFGREEKDLFLNYGESLKGIVFGNNCHERDISRTTSMCTDVSFEN